MIKKLNSRLAMVCVSERTRRFLERRTPKAGFLFIPKSKFMSYSNQLKVTPYFRQLTVSYMYQSGKFSVPFIRLCGKWLEDAGFSVEDKVKITVKDNLLILEPVK